MQQTAQPWHSTPPSNGYNHMTQPQLGHYEHQSNPLLHALIGLPLRNVAKAIGILAASDLSVACRWDQAGEGGRIKGRIDVGKYKKRKEKRGYMKNVPGIMYCTVLLYVLRIKQECLSGLVSTQVLQ